MSSFYITNDVSSTVVNSITTQLLQSPSWASIIFEFTGQLLDNSYPIIANSQTIFLPNNTTIGRIYFNSDVTAGNPNENAEFGIFLYETAAISGAGAPTGIDVTGLTTWSPLSTPSFISSSNATAKSNDGGIGPFGNYLGVYVSNINGMNLDFPSSGTATLLIEFIPNLQFPNV